MRQTAQSIEDLPTLVVSETEDIKRVPQLSARRIYFLMRLINAFERRVVELKRSDCVWGPIHLSIGQEAVATASLAALEAGDKIAGSHRAHHVFLAKALLHVLPPEWDPVAGSVPPEAQEVVNRTLAEIMGLAPGFCGGRGGSMHLRWIEAGILGTNAIVAGGVPLSAGAALAERYRETGRVVVCYLGDGAVNQGSFHEACNLAGLWKLPIIYAIENNRYAVATAARDACAIENLARHALSYNMIGRSVYGYDPVGVYLAVREVSEAIRAGDRPAVIEFRCYRHYHHGGDLPGSAYGYRKKEEESEWLERDALNVFPKILVTSGAASEEATAGIERLAESAADGAVDFCALRDHADSDGRARFHVREELWPDRSTVAVGLRSDGKELAGLRYREREDFDELREITFSDAIATVTGRWLERDPETIVLGEEVANFGGGAYGATKGLPAKYPGRVRNTPISEAGFTGMALGLAMSGMRPVVEIMFPDFTLVAADQIFNQIAKARHMYGGADDLPLVLRTRIATGCGYGGQHSMDPIGLYALFPGWRIVAPSDAFDYIGLFNTAMHSLDPVAILEHHSLYDRSFPVPADDPDYCIPFGRARVVRAGCDMSVLTYGSMTGRLNVIAERLAARSIELEVVDLRSVDAASIDYETIGASIAKTGVVAVYESAAGGQAIGRRIASEIAERFFDELDAPPGVYTSLDIPNPVSRVLEAEAMIDDVEIVESIVAMVERREILRRG